MTQTIPTPRAASQEDAVGLVSQFYTELQQWRIVLAQATGVEVRLHCDLHGLPDAIRDRVPGTTRGKAADLLGTYLARTQLNLYWEQ